MNYDSWVEKELKIHSTNEMTDQATVNFLASVLQTSGGRIAAKFAACDKWPNIDGNFEFIPNPKISRRPAQNFIVQIKGTTQHCETDKGITYCLKSLAFPAYLKSEVTLDPGILFVVTDPENRRKRRIFWKYMSAEFFNSITNTGSTTILFTNDDEIEDTDESVKSFCKKLEKITEVHLFVSQLEKNVYSCESARKKIESCSKKISKYIAEYDSEELNREEISEGIVSYLNELCVATLIYSALNGKDGYMQLQTAWEIALLSNDSKFLASYYRGLKYINHRHPEDGQNERLMLKYYEFLCRTKEFLNKKFGIRIIENLYQFPLDTDKIDQEYYDMVSEAIKNMVINHNEWFTASRYYIHKKTPFFVNGKRYYEITLQLAGMYTSKFNRFTAYTDIDISTNYSIQIKYQETDMKLWRISSKIKVITGWRVSIDPHVMNEYAKLLKIETRISHKYGEYKALMRFLTNSGMTLLDLIDWNSDRFAEILNSIYPDGSTAVYKNVLLKLKQDYSRGTNAPGKNTLRFLLLNLNEANVDSALSNGYDLYDDLRIAKRCRPFERNPLISNFPDTKSSENQSIGKVCGAVEDYSLREVTPYLRIRNQMRQTGEVYFPMQDISDAESIQAYNDFLDFYEKNTMNDSIKEENDLVCIESYEKTTLDILQRLYKASSTEVSSDQKSDNKQFVKTLAKVNIDESKVAVLTNVFVSSRILLVYGSAGTGKTTLMNYISALMPDTKKLYLTKTHTALENLKRRIDNVDGKSEFDSINHAARQGIAFAYDIIFIDECSTIDNRIMQQFLRTVKPNALLVMVGDIYQIESIEFGNWFYYAKEIIENEDANVELTNTWRTTDPDLKSLWAEVREKKPLITEHLVIDGPFSENIGESIFERSCEDEIVLCLNYDGKFGLNNMNNYFQNANPNELVTWQEWGFKKGDRILFNESQRFPALYNNLKGTIVEIQAESDSITFIIDVELVFNSSVPWENDFTIVEKLDNKTRIKFTVFSYDDDDEIPRTSYEYRNKKLRGIIPFQLAYAVSIHKAQGLEYDSVKIVIPSSNAERITHGIFYTAITRARKKLKIYWSSEVMASVVKNITESNTEHRSLQIIKRKMGIE